MTPARSVRPGFGLYLVVGGGELELGRALAAIDVAPHGALAVQGRWKDAPDAVVLARTARLLEVATPRDVPVLVSGRADLAMRAGARGVHLPEAGPEVGAARATLRSDALVGASCHDAAGIARRAGADFVVLGPVGDVPGKGPPLSDATFAGLVARASMPVFALGGVRDAASVRRLRALGARGVAVQRAILESDEPGRVLAELLAGLA